MALIHLSFPANPNPLPTLAPWRHVGLVAQALCRTWFAHPGVARPVEWMTDRPSVFSSATAA